VAELANLPAGEAALWRAADLSRVTLGVWRIEGGLVQSFEQFTDTLLVAQAMR
jgi:hypothetical protein